MIIPHDWTPASFNQANAIIQGITIIALTIMTVLLARKLELRSSILQCIIIANLALALDLTSTVLRLMSVKPVLIDVAGQGIPATIPGMGDDEHIGKLFSIVVFSDISALLSNISSIALFLPIACALTTGEFAQRRANFIFCTMAIPLAILGLVVHGLLIHGHVVLLGIYKKWIIVPNGENIDLLRSLVKTYARSMENSYTATIFLYVFGTIASLGLLLRYWRMRDQLGAGENKWFPYLIFPGILIQHLAPLVVTLMIVTNENYNPTETEGVLDGNAATWAFLGAARSIGIATAVVDSIATLGLTATFTGWYFVAIAWEKEAAISLPDLGVARHLNATSDPEKGKTMVIVHESKT